MGNAGIKHEVAEEVRAAVERIFLLKDFSLEQLSLEEPPHEDLGDFALGCFPIARLLRKSPEQVASELQGGFSHSGLIKEVKAVGPYLNIYLDATTLSRQTCTAILEAGDFFGTTNIGTGTKVMVEYSSPNTNKPQHLGHVRNNLLGMAVSNILKAVGYTVIKANLVNDRGIHICKSMLAYQKWGKGKTPESEGIKGDHFVGSFYVLFEKEHYKQVQAMRADGTASPKLTDSEVPTPILQGAQELLRRWEDGDPEVITLWRTMNDWVLQGFKQTYQRIGAGFDKWYFESETYKLGRDIIFNALTQGKVYKRPDGATAIDLVPHGLREKVLLRADGTSVYITQDIGTAKLKFDDFGLDKSIYVVASEQDHHFQVLFKILEVFGFEWARNCYHLSYGMVNLPEGRMKSREGKVVDADDLMENLKTLARERIIEKQTRLSAEQVDELAEKVGLGALKFYILKVTPRRDTTFDPKSSLKIKDATGPYIQYTHARLASILKRSPLQPSSKVDYSLLSEAEEKRIIKLLSSYPDVLVIAADAYNPAFICAYLLDLCRAFNDFYQKHQVINSGSEKLTEARLQIVKSMQVVVKNGLRLLGIEAPEEM